MRPTRRGYMFTLVCLVALSAGIMYGPRALDAVVIPGFIALFASIIDIWRVSEPSVERTLPSPAEPGTKAQISLKIKANRPVPVRAVDTIQSGLTGTPAIETVADGTSAEYELTRRDRGCHTIGPVTVRLRDRLGLFERVFMIDNTDSVTVFPQICSLTPVAANALRNTTSPTAGPKRGSFEGLREYTRGDALRDVHWKSSARHDDLFTRDFGSAADQDTQLDSLTVAVNIEQHSDSSIEFVDAAATAAASICIEALDQGAGVQLQTPTGNATAVAGSEDAILERLAEFSLPVNPLEDNVANADIYVTVRAESVIVYFGERTVDFGDLLSIHDLESQDGDTVSMIADREEQTLKRNYDDNITVSTDAHSDDSATEERYT